MREAFEGIKICLQAPPMELDPLQTQNIQVCSTQNASFAQRVTHMKHKILLRPIVNFS